MHIEGGDFYVYYTKDEKSEYTNPRIAIRTENGKLAEVRGIAENQNLESNMEKVVEEKLKEFPDAEAYFRIKYGESSRRKIKGISRCRSI